MIDVGRKSEHGVPGRFALPDLGSKQFSHILAVGETGSGKSTIINRIIERFARRPGIALVLLDFKGGMELMPWADRATVVLDDPDRAATVLDPALAAIQARGKLATDLADLEQSDIRFYEPRMGPGVLIVCDELAELKRNPTALKTFDSIAAMGRAVGVGVVAATQYAPKSDYPSRLLVNLRTRLVHRMGTPLEYGTSLRVSTAMLERWRFEGFTVDEAGHAIVSGASGTRDGAIVKATVVTNPRRVAAETAAYRWRPEQVFQVPPAEWVAKNYPRTKAS